MVSGFGSIATAANVVTTILCMRCMGMTLFKMPLLAWLNLVMCGMVLVAVSPIVRGDVRPNQQGLGLGLYIASEIAHAHGGTVEVTSDAEETRFTFRMPLVPASA